MRDTLYNISLLLILAVCIFISVVVNYGDKQGTRKSMTNAFSKAFVDMKGLFGGTPAPTSTPLRAFQLNYLLVYSLVFVSDWLQGPYIYALYKSYGYELDSIALLFVAGFLSSAIFGTFVGSLADRLGRKLGALIFCVTYIASCLTKLSPAFNVLMLGRLLGGVSTSLLFSVFESWMVAEHRARLFDEDSLSETFAWSTFANALAAIVSGVVANIVVEIFGLVAPFMVASLALLAAGYVIQTTWTENYGQKQSETASQPSFLEVIGTIRANQNIFAVGTMQFCFESAMYTFVFLWSPVMEKAAGDTSIKLPFGVMFSSFMVCMMIGSTMFKVAVGKHVAFASIATLTFAVAAVALLIPAIVSNEAIVYIAFNLFEACCGVYFPSVGTIRSQIVPEATRSTVMNIFRIPLNLIVVVILLKVDALPSQVFFLLCAGLISVAYYYSMGLAERLKMEHVSPDYEKVSEPGASH